MTDEITKRRMEAIDRKYWSPEERATGVLNLIEHMRTSLRKDNLKRGVNPDEDVPSDLDLLHFAVAYMGQQAIAIDDETFLNIAVAANRWLQSVHYTVPESLYGEPDKES